MDKNTLSEYGWIIVIVIILSIMLVFATPFGRFIINSISNSTDRLFTLTNDMAAHVNPLKSPKQLAVDVGDSYTLSFDAVSGADGYIVKINDGQEIITTNTSLDITDYLDGLTGAVQIEVIATDSTGTRGNSRPATYKHRMPGLYETGTYNLIKSWDTLVSEGAIVVSEGVATTNVNMSNSTNASSAVLDGDLVISKDVTGVGDYGFALCANLTEVVMPNTITNMGQAAFGLCNELKNVTLSKKLASIPMMAFMQSPALQSINVPDSVASIGDYAFYGTSALESVYIGSGVASVGRVVFSGCSNLSTIVVSPENATYHSYDYGNCIIETDTKTLILGCKGSVIPADGSVTTIGAQAFIYCSGLERIVIPDNVTVIKELAFAYCENLKTATMSNNIETIEDDAFLCCENLKNITLPEGLTTLGASAFAYCYKLNNVALPSTLAIINIDTFAECRSLTEIIIPEGVTTIKENAFGRCSGVTRVHIPSSVTSIHKKAFYALSSLETISVSASNPVYHVQDECLIKTAAKSLILGCKNSVIPDDGTVTHIENYAFQECIGLKHMYIPKEITRIEVEAFMCCGNLESIVVEEGNPTYRSVDNCLIHGNKLRYGCKNSIIPGDGSVRSLENQSFRGCIGLTNVYIPKTIEEVDTHAFFDCVNIETIVVEEGNPVYHSEGNCLIETATKDVRLGCKNSVIPTNGSVTSVYGPAFADETPITTLVIPDSMTVLGLNNFDDIIHLERVYLPGTLTEIKTYCFDGCYNLRDVYYDGTIDQWNAVAKSSSWIDSEHSYTIHCTDGDIVVNN